MGEGRSSDLASSVRIITSTLTDRSYAEAPVSPLLLFGRSQDAAFQQEVSGNPAQRHHVRLWRTPPGWLLPGGHRVDWLAGGTYDRRVGLSLFTLQITHKIDADIDVERDFIVASVSSAEPAVSVEPLVDFTTGYHARNGGGDTVRTDGTLPVVDLSAVVPAAESDPPATTSSQARLPFQVLLPAILTIVVGPLSLLAAILDADRFTSRTERLILVVLVALAATSVLCAVWMLSRSAWARRWLLLLSSLIAAAQISEYELAKGPALQLLATYHAGVMILVVVALSSPAATAWSGGVRSAAHVAQSPG